MISREDTEKKVLPRAREMNRDGEDMLPVLPHIPEYVASSFQMSYPLGVNQRTNQLDSIQGRYCHK